MACIDYEKAYDMVPHLWIIECLDLFGVVKNIKSLLVSSMDKWKVMLCSRYFSRRFFIPFSVFLALNSIKFDFRKGKDSI